MPDEVVLSNPDHFADGAPVDWFRRMRREDPVPWTDEEEGPGFWSVLGYEDVREISRTPDLWSSWIGGSQTQTLTDDSLALVRSIMINMDPPRHVQYRRLVQRGFTPRMIAKTEPHTRELCTRIIDAVCEKGECDFVNDLAALLPMHVICEMVGVPESDRHYLYELSNRLIGFDDPDFNTSLEDAGQASAEIFLYAQKLAEEKRKRPADDLATVLLEAEVEGERLSEMDFNAFFMLLAIAGNETTRTASSHGMRLLMEYPDARDQLVADRGSEKRHRKTSRAGRSRQEAANTRPWPRRFHPWPTRRERRQAHRCSTMRGS